MKTPLTFLLALTFLFLFSGSVYGGVFDKKNKFQDIAGANPSMAILRKGR
jgi:hypothetical protein